MVDVPTHSSLGSVSVPQMVRQFVASPSCYSCDVPAPHIVQQLPPISSGDVLLAQMAHQVAPRSPVVGLSSAADPIGKLTGRLWSASCWSCICCAQGKNFQK